MFCVSAVALKQVFYAGRGAFGAARSQIRIYGASMIILAHRGLWQSAEEKNTLAAFERAFTAGFGVELDVRDLDGTLVVSHDPPRAGCLRFSTVLDLYQKCGTPGRMAINIKADGLAPEIVHLLTEHQMHKTCFVFDMSVPDMLSYNNSEIITFTRHSEYEALPCRLDVCQGVWVDAFENPWADENKILYFINENKTVALVSPELHGKPHLEAWSVWRNALRCSENYNTRCSAIMICTDYPEDAKQFFLLGDNHDQSDIVRHGRRSD